jgi:hypothetical protein
MMTELNGGVHRLQSDGKRPGNCKEPGHIDLRYALVQVLF